MDKLIIEGGTRLEGTVKVSGSKNAALPILAATLMSEGDCTISNVPPLRDMFTICRILNELGVETHYEGGTVSSRLVSDKFCVAPYDLVRTMRASICVLGPLLARRGRAKVSLPGGCVIGSRPIDLHIKGLAALGAKIKIEHGYVVAEADRLRGTEIYLGGPHGSTVTGTANILCAATLAEGTTIIEGAACEPEVADLAAFLNAMGAQIRGVGTHRLEVEGVTSLGGCEYAVIPDRIEAGTFATAAILTGGRVQIANCRAEDLSAVIDVFTQIGGKITPTDNGICVEGSGRIATADVTTHAYPGFPTDLQAQVMVLLSLAGGISVVTEKIYPDRFMHVAELNRMGAKIRKEGSIAIVVGAERLTGAPVMASDLRASAALVLAGLVAEGTTQISRVYHIDRGYEKIEEKFNALGARMTRVDEPT